MNAVTFKRIELDGKIGIVRARNVDEALHAVAAVVDHMKIIEFTTGLGDLAYEALQALKKEYEDEVVACLGTVTLVSQARRGVEAGAEVIVSPTYHQPVIDECTRLNVSVFPGAYTPTEVLICWFDDKDSEERKPQVDGVKVFPTEGRTTIIKEIRAPISYVPLVPTGGCTADNVYQFIMAGGKGNAPVVPGIGNNVFNPDIIAAGNWKALTSVAKRVHDEVNHAHKDLAV